MRFSATAALVAALSSVSVMAADCAGANWGKPDMALYWTAREVACNGNKQYSDARVSISYTGSAPSAQVCWDGTENILKQCIANGKLLRGS